MQRLFLFVMLTGFLALTSCGSKNESSTETEKTEKGDDSNTDASKSQKGKWIESEKTKALQVCKEEMEKVLTEDADFQSLKLNTDDVVKRTCDCYINKAEEMYESYASADGDLAGMTKIGEECGKSVMKEVMSEKSK